MYKRVLTRVHYGRHTAERYDENVHIYTTDMYERQGMLLAQAAYTTRRYVMYPRFLTPQLYTSTFMYCSKREA